ncbi:AraC family transcriptional regulator [Oceanimonas sp. NS1]|nr:AraC family transcriptional regulator [Oceanimonas sp. NS1]
MLLRHLVGPAQPKLAEVVALMEANLEEPITLDELAHYVGLSRRQVERLFQRHVKCSPSRYYLNLRLKRPGSCCARPHCRLSTSPPPVALSLPPISASAIASALACRPRRPPEKRHHRQPRHGPAGK